MSQVDDEQELIDDIGGFTLDPPGYTRYNFPWGEDKLHDGRINPLSSHKGPRKWQEDTLNDIRDHLQNPETRFEPCFLATASGHGIGKSALIGMLIKWALDTCPNTRVICTSNTENQLRTKTVPEVTKWSKLSLTSHWFDSTATAIYSTEKSHGNTLLSRNAWRCDFIPWSKDNSEAFAGLHNEGNRILVVFDEASAIADKIWEVTEGAMTDTNTEIIWVAFGNPTQNIGRFRECFRRYSKYWITRNIDSREVEGTNKKYFDRIIEQYGEDSNNVKVRVKGQFPSQSARQLFNQDDLDAARGRHLRDEQYAFAPKIICCDPAWEGDDALIIGVRQGLYYCELACLAKNTNDMEVAQAIARHEDSEKADAVFIDGGYGTGIVSGGRTLNRTWQLVWFSGKSGRIDCFNKRAEMFLNLSDWIKDGGAIPDDQELYDELISLETIPTLDGKYKLPPKDEIKELIGRSPNKADCLAISFAFPVSVKAKAYSQNITPIKKYNPIRDRLR